ncbi:MAG: TatD family hydrolase [Saprospiraceae bacterium]
MKWIDTHTHLYLDEFDQDRKEMMMRLSDVGIVKVLLPNIDVRTIESMINMKKEFSEQVDLMFGLHPCSVKEDYLEQLSEIEKNFKDSEVVGVGEIGLDLYWDKTYFKEQLDAFEIQLKWACALNLPVSIHSREATAESIASVEKFGGQVKGVFHCFSGSVKEAKKVIDMGMYLGIGGVVTYKNTNLAEVINSVGLNRIVLETDSPYLSPNPHRGKRNESSYIPIIGQKIAEILDVGIETIAELTYTNSINVFYKD